MAEKPGKLSAEELLEAPKAGDTSLMKAMQEINGKKSTGQCLPDNIEGKTEHHASLGECIVQLSRVQGGHEH